MKDGEKMQIHNWIVEKVEMDEVDYIEVRTVAGDFRMMYKIGTIMYSLLSSMDVKDEGSYEGLSIIFNNAYTAATLVDKDLQHNILMSIVKFIEDVSAGEFDEEEDLRIVEEEKQAYMENEKEEDSDNGVGNTTQQ